MEELAEELQAFSISIAGEFKEANMWADEKERYKPNSWPYHLKAMDDYPNDMGLFTQLGTMSEYKDPNKGFHFWDGEQIIESKESKPVTVTIKPEDLDKLSQELQAFSNANVYDHIDRVISYDSLLTKYIERSIVDQGPMNWYNPNKMRLPFVDEAHVPGATPEQMIKFFEEAKPKLLPNDPPVINFGSSGKLYATELDRECEHLKEYLSWCIEKRFINRIHPELLSGPLPEFTEWKVNKILNKYRQLPLMLHSTVDLFDINRSINIFNPFKHGKITDENGRRIK